MNTNTQTVSGKLVDLYRREIYPVIIRIKDGRITSIERAEASEVDDVYIIPPFVDAHIHIESSLLVPTEFARLAVCHGTVATVSDPHEIANVCGKDGVLYMLANAKQTPFKFAFGAPSCVPATNSSIETAGAVLGLEEVTELLGLDDIFYLAEVMNFPAVLAGQEPYLGMIAAANAVGKPSDGHFPGGRGQDVITYAQAGISTDHECTTLAEALEKVAAGMHILIREGSAAKNFEALAPLLREHPERVMFCSDDKHPHELRRGHINELVVRAISDGYSMWDVLKAASHNPVKHYNLPVGLLQVGDAADFVLVKDLVNFDVLKTFIDGELVFSEGVSHMPQPEVEIINQFRAEPISVDSLRLPTEAQSARVRVIGVDDGQLVTNALEFELQAKDGCLCSDTAQDVLKLVVVNRYEPNVAPAIAFVHGVKLKQGALASSVAHDSHNIVAVGVDDQKIATAINLIIESQGGLSVVNGEQRSLLPLPVAGLMSAAGGFSVADQYSALHQDARRLGSDLHDPLMMLSFLALPVIPSLKMTDKGLFDVSTFSHVDLFI